MLQFPESHNRLFSKFENIAKILEYTLEIINTNRYIIIIILLVKSSILKWPAQ